MLGFNASDKKKKKCMMGFRRFFAWVSDDEGDGVGVDGGKRGWKEGNR